MQEQIGRPIADRIYRSLFGQDAGIVRTSGDILDRTFAVDVIINPTVSPPVNLQEKFLSYEYAHFGSLTIEYMQNPATGERGDWFRLACQLYFVGYLTKDEGDFSPWALVDMARLSLATVQGRIVWTLNANKNGQARASFMYTSIGDLPNDCVIAKRDVK